MCEDSMVLKCGIFSMVGDNQLFLSGGLAWKVVRISYSSQFLDKNRCYWSARRIYVVEVMRRVYVVDVCEGSISLKCWKDLCC